MLLGPVRSFAFSTLPPSSKILPSIMMKALATRHPVRVAFQVFCLAAIGLCLTACGSGGYPGGGIESLSVSSATIDSGQSLSVVSAASTGSQVSWSLSGTSCTANTCGTLSAPTGSSVIYTAPANLSAAIQVTLTGAVAGTTNARTVAITVNPDPVISGVLSAATVGTTYSSTLTTSGGTSPLKGMTISAGSLPTGLTFTPATGIISGTPTTSGVFSFSVSNTDASYVPYTVTAQESITVTAQSSSALSLDGNFGNGTVGAPFAGTLQASGGTGSYSFAMLSGSLPAGLQLSPGSGIVSGTPTTQGTSAFVAQVQDSAGNKASANFSITVGTASSSLAIAVSNLPAGTVSVPYSQTIGVTGGTGPYTCSVTGGSLPAGLAIGSNCLVSGTPTTAGTSVFSVKATDSSNPAQTANGSITLTIAPATLAMTVSTLPGGTVGVPYSQTIGATGGTAPYNCTIMSGSLPVGLTLGANCLVSGTPTTAGTSNAVVKVTDSANPAQTTTGPISITIAPATLAIAVSSLPNGAVGVTYSQTIGVTGGTAPYSCAVTSGSLPAGLALGANCLVSGTPTTPGTSNAVVKVTDSASPAQTATGPISITISPATLSLAVSSLPNGMVGVTYSQTIGTTGGVAPYSCTVMSGSLPAGLALGANCLVSGTPTTPGTSNAVVKVTDSASPAQTATGPISITISPATLSLAVSSLPNGMVNVPYSQTIGAIGGVAPYSCTITSGSLPAGLALGANCLVSGTPTTAGTSNATVKVTDSGNPAQTTSGPVSLTISPATLTLTMSTLPGGTVAVPYSQTIGVAGGTAPYTCTILTGTLPAGLTFGAHCLVSGTPTVTGTFNPTIMVSDSSNPAATVSAPVSITIAPAAAVLTITSPPNATANAPYTGTIGVTGGTAPYTCTITVGALPTGLSINNCTITGTPSGPSNTPLTVKVTDSSSPSATNTGSVTLMVNAAPTVLTITPPASASVGIPYTGTIGVSGGTAPYACTINAGTLPAGLSINNCTITGTPTASGTSTLTVTATDGGTPRGTITGQVTLTVAPIATLTLTGSLPSARLNVLYTQTLTATGGLPPYQYSVSAGTLPAGLTLSAAGVLSGTPTTIGASSFTVTVTDTETTPQTASLPLILQVLYPSTSNDAIFNGPYAFLFQGYDDVVAGVLAYKTATIGSFTADGVGGIALGELDANHQNSQATQGSTVGSNAFLGTYTVGTDDRGTMAITTLDAQGNVGQTRIYSISLKAPAAPATTTAEGSLIETDDDQLQGTKGSGTILAQQASTFATGLNGSYAFGLSGDTSCLISCTVGLLSGPVASVGEFTANGSGIVTGGTSDANIASSSLTNLPLSGTYNAADANGRMQLVLNTGDTGTTAYPYDYAVYLVGADRALVMSINPHSSSILLAGSAERQTQPTFSNASMNGPFIGYENSATNPGLVAGLVLQNVLNFSTATIFRGTGTGDANCAITNVDQAGVTSLLGNVTGLLGSLTGLTNLLGAYDVTGSTTCAVASNGRGILQYPTATLLGLPIGTPPAPRIFYLSAPNHGYFLETGYAAVGQFEAQTGAPFTLANTFTGSYIYGETPASSLATINSSGIIQSDGAGHATSTLDLNVGVGTINVLQLGQTTTQTYTAPDPTTGRFTLNGNIVIYPINAGRYALIDTNPLTTSPSVSILY